MNDETWTWQMSWKVGPHMLNHRTTEFEELLQGMQKVSDNASEIAAHANAFEALKPPAPATTLPLEASKPTGATAPAPAPVRASEPPSGAKGLENGPVVVLGIETKEDVSKKTGKPYTIYYGNLGGTKVSTFDTLLAAAMKSLMGKSCYFTATKTDFGNKLESIRSA